MSVWWRDKSPFYFQGSTIRDSGGTQGMDISMVAGHWGSLRPIPIGKPFLSSAENGLSKVGQSLKMVWIIRGEASGCPGWLVTNVIMKTKDCNCHWIWSSMRTPESGVLMIYIGTTLPHDHHDNGLTKLSSWCCYWQGVHVCREPGGAACMDQHPH